MPTIRIHVPLTSEPLRLIVAPLPTTKCHRAPVFVHSCGRMFQSAMRTTFSVHY